jgi:hypothetical protein
MATRKPFKIMKSLSGWRVDKAGSDPYLSRQSAFGGGVRGRPSSLAGLPDFASIHPSASMVLVI